MRRSFHSMRSVDKGFTLIELQVVITIVALLLFIPVVSINLASSPLGIARISLSSDAYDDIAVLRMGTAANSDIVEIRKTDSSGVLAAPQTYTIPAGAKRIAVTRFDSDLNDDILTLHDRGAQPAILTVIRSSAGALLPYDTYSLGITQPSNFASADLNADGRSDVVVASANSVQGYTLSLLVSNGPTILSPAIVLHVSGQVQELMGSGPITPLDSISKDNRVYKVEQSRSIELGANASKDTTDSSYSPIISLNATGIRSLALANVAGDARPDIVFAGADSGSSFVQILENRFPEFVEVATLTLAQGGFPEALVTSDFNADGFIDIAVADSSNHSVSIFRNLGNGGFGAEQLFTTGESPVALSVVNLENDDYTDLVVSTQSATVAQGALASISVLSNLGLPGISFIRSDIVAGVAGVGPSAVVSGNFNPGGTANDLLLMNMWPGGLIVFTKQVL